MLPPAPPHLQENALPWGNLVLADGRILRFIEALPPKLRTPKTVDSGRWRAADGLHVIATLERHGDHYTRHISLSYPDRLPTAADVQAVQQRFFAAHHVVERLAAQRHAVNELDPYCIHLVQPHDPPAHTVSAA